MEFFHLKHADEVVQFFDSSQTTGLSSSDAEERLKKHGPNELKEKKGRGPLKMLLGQFTETMVVILIIAAIISGFLGKEIETIAISAIVVLFAVLGFVQEYRAEKAMAALKKMSVPFVKVIRDGALKEISAKKIVPGDIIMMEAGNIIPADVRIIESSNLRIQESALTGEADSVEKSTAPIAGSKNPAIGDRVNMAFRGTTVNVGRGKAVVVATGMDTELGKIAGMIQNVETQKTLLQRKLDQLGKWLAAAGGVAAVLVMIIGVIEGESAADMFLVGISVAVAVIPEGLPAVVTITLALGSQKMLRQNALIRKLPAVESLGSVTTICSDKTGTLTENKMTLTAIETAGSIIPFPSSNGYPDGTKLVLMIGTLCNDAILQEQDKEKTVIGEPTESALVAGSDILGYNKHVLENSFPRVAEVPFDSDRKRMSTVHKRSEANLPDELKEVQSFPFSVMTKGAVDRLLQISTHIWTSEGIAPINQDWIDRIIKAHDDLAEKGIRVLGVAFKGLQELPDQKEAEKIEDELVFAGMVGLIDPARPAVKPAVEKCKAAGIRPIMITGDYPLTAKAIANELGIGVNSEYVTGEMLDKMSDEELDSVVSKVNVFARVSPKDKLRIVTALQKQGEIVAMTGDGVNDSPALKKADIGVSMGITGTDVAKEASDMVLLDDNFATIVNSVEEGRTIFDNLLRFVKFSLGGNFGKVLVMLIAPLLGIVVALRPLQLLWLNLLTDGLMGLGLGVEPSEKNVMKRPPRSMAAPILDRKAIIHVLWTGVLIGIITLGVAYYYYNPAQPEDIYWQSMLFCTIGFTQIGHAIGLRASSYSVFSFSSNMLFTGMLFLTLILHLGVIYLPFANKFFSLVPLEGIDLLISFILGMVLLIGVQIERRILIK
ncbi:MAG: cation-translocating P-type ATPase [Candidatus Cyclobacteriaceae bacterium M2_1C_046]